MFRLSPVFLFLPYTPQDRQSVSWNHEGSLDRPWQVTVVISPCSRRGSKMEATGTFETKEKMSEASFHCSVACTHGVLSVHVPFCTGYGLCDEV